MIFTPSSIRVFKRSVSPSPFKERGTQVEDSSRGEVTITLFLFLSILFLVS